MSIDDKKFPDFIKINYPSIINLKSSYLRNVGGSDYYLDAGGYYIRVQSQGNSYVATTRHAHQGSGMVDKFYDDFNNLPVETTSKVEWYMNSFLYYDLLMTINPVQIEKLEGLYIDYIRNFKVISTEERSFLTCLCKNSLSRLDSKINISNLRKQYFLSEEFEKTVYEILFTYDLPEDKLAEISGLQNQYDYLHEITIQHDNPIPNMDESFRMGFLAGITLALVKLEGAIESIKGDNSYGN